MSRLIDAEALMADCQLAQKQADRHGREFANAFYSGGGEISTEWWCVEDMIENAPTIEERKVGKWLDAEWENINTGEKRKGRRCSVCKCGYFRYDVSVNTVSDIPNFCPNCGAKMEGKT